MRNEPGGVNISLPELGGPPPREVAGTQVVGTSALIWLMRDPLRLNEIWLPASVVPERVTDFAAASLAPVAARAVMASAVMVRFMVSSLSGWW